jgi:hypothetical protein
MNDDGDVSLRIFPMTCSTKIMIIYQHKCLKNNRKYAKSIPGTRTERLKSSERLFVLQRSCCYFKTCSCSIGV